MNVMLSILLAAATEVPATPPPMDWGAIIDWAITFLVALGGLGGIVAFLTVRAQKRKIMSESNRTEAEAESITADAQGKRTDQRWIQLLDSGDQMLKRMQERLDDAEERIDLLTEYVEILVTALRTHGAPIPPMPRRMAEDARNRTDVRDHPTT